MSFRSGRACAHALLLAAVGAAGCTARREIDANRSVVADRALRPAVTDVHVTGSNDVENRRDDRGVYDNVATVAHLAPADEQPPTPAPPAPLPAESFAETLDLAVYVHEVLARNRSLQAMVAAWRAAAEKYPQAVALDDPMFTAMTAPSSWSSDDVNAAYLLGGSQKIPWWGKRSLRGQVARAEANAASMDVADARLQLTQAAHLAYFDYYLVHRQLELADANIRNLEDFQAAARRQYEASLVRQQDVLQAEVELAEGERRRIELERMRRTSIARLNTLIHRPPDCPVLPPPASLTVEGLPAPPDLLRQVAQQQRPDLASMRAKLQAESASVALAYKEFYPDFEVMGRYDRFWQPTDTFGDLQGQFGVNMNVPIYLEKRRAAAREAMFKLRRQRAEYEQRIDDVNQEVESAYAQVLEMHAVVELYAQRTLPAAERNVASARNDYVVNRGDFLRLVSAQRQSLMLQEKYQEAVAGYLSRRAELERVIGGSLPMEAKGRAYVP
jgi:outer membrane protein TolC